MTGSRRAEAPAPGVPRPPRRRAAAGGKAPRARPRTRSDASGAGTGGESTPLALSLRPRGPVRVAFTERERAGATLLEISGELDVLTAPKLAARLDALVRRRTGDVVVDLNEASFVDSAGLHILLNAQRRLTRQSRSLAVVCKPGPVRRVVELARLAETLGVVTSFKDYRSRAAARERVTHERAAHSGRIGD